jgi:hypothetical protein
VDVEDVIARCRGLRNISYVEAKQLILRAYLFFVDFFKKKKKLKLIVTGIVDNYVMDIMERVGKSSNVQFLGVASSFVSTNYKLITVRGETSKISAVDDNVVFELYEKLKNKPVSPMVPSFKKAIFSAGYNLASYTYRYFVRYIFKYKLLGRLEYEYRFTPFLHGLKSINQIQGLKYLKKIKNIPSLKKGGKYAYIPLHCVPEATVDYWFNDLYDVDYLTSVVDAISKLKESGYCVLVKEHPAFYLSRFKEFYQKIENAGGIMISPFTSTKDVFEIIDTVVVWSGSTGIEAVVNKKAVIKVTNNYYGDGIIPNLNDGCFPVVLDDIKAKEIVQKVLDTSFKPG